VEKTEFLGKLTCKKGSMTNTIKMNIIYVAICDKICLITNPFAKARFAKDLGKAFAGGCFPYMCSFKGRVSAYLREQEVRRIQAEKDAVEAAEAAVKLAEAQKVVASILKSRGAARTELVKSQDKIVESKLKRQEGVDKSFDSVCKPIVKAEKKVYQAPVTPVIPTTEVAKPTIRAVARAEAKAVRDAKAGTKSEREARLLADEKRRASEKLAALKITEEANRKSAAVWKAVDKSPLAVVKPVVKPLSVNATPFTPVVKPVVVVAPVVPEVVVVAPVVPEVVDPRKAKKEQKKKKQQKRDDDTRQFFTSFYR